MIYDLNEIANLPDTFSLEDLRVVCHISKRTARYYLRAGLIPCEISDKKTHCYTIRKQDLLDALKEYQSRATSRTLFRRFLSATGCARSAFTICATPARV